MTPEETEDLKEGQVWDCGEFGICTILHISNTIVTVVGHKRMIFSQRRTFKKLLSSPTCKLNLSTIGLES